MKRAALFLLLPLFSTPIAAMSRLQGDCSKGGASIYAPPAAGQVPQLRSMMQSFPSCTVSVFNAGTTTAVLIYATNGGTALGNPFQADMFGHWFFYAPNGVYDVQISGGGMPQPYTFGAIQAFDISTAGGGATSFSTLTSGTNTSAVMTVGSGASLTASGGTINFSAAASTIPFQTGTIAALPAGCTTGQKYFAIDAPAGGNDYNCVSGTWTPESSGGGGGMTSFTQITSGTNINQVLTVGNNSVLNYGGSGQLKASQIADASGNIVVLPIAVAGATDYITATNGAPGTPGLVQLAAAGTDTNINLRLASKGTGVLQLNGPAAFVDNAGNLTVTACSGCGGGGGLPVVDTTALVKNVTDATKQIRLSAANLSTATTTTLTAQNANYTLAGLEPNQTFTGSDIFTNTVMVGLTSTDFTFTSGVISQSGFLALSAPTNSSGGSLYVSGTSVVVGSGHSGSGTTLPIDFISDTTTVGRFPPSSSINTRSLLVGLTSSDFAFTDGIISKSGFLSLSAATNASAGSFYVSPGTSVIVGSGATGSGTVLPLAFWEGNGEVARFTVPGSNTQGSFLVGLTSSDQSFQNGVISRGGFLAASATTNASLGFLNMAPGVSVGVGSTSTGTGTVLPFTFNMGAAEVARFTAPAGEFLVGLTSTDWATTAGNIVVNGSLNVVSSSANASGIGMGVQGGSYTWINSAETGTGVQLPLAFLVGGTESGRWTIPTSNDAGSLLIGLTSSDQAFTNGLISKSGMLIATAATNASLGFIFQNGTSIGIGSGHSGTGTTLPLMFDMDSAEVARFATPASNDAGSLLIGLSSSDQAFNNGLISKSGMLIATATTNASLGFIFQNGVSIAIGSGHSGTGTTLPIQFDMDSVAEETIRPTTGVHLMGITSTDGSFGNNSLVTRGTLAVVTGPTNASVTGLDAAGGVSTLYAAVTGAGAYQPLAFFVSNGEVARFNTATTNQAGSLLVGITTSDHPNFKNGVIAKTGFLVQPTTTNASIGFLFNAGPTITLGSGHTGTGTDLPVLFAVGSTSSMQLNTNGNVTVNSGSITLFTTTFANLGTWGTTNGGIVYCNDCTNSGAATACAGGGGGKLAYRVAGAWDCI